MEIPGYITKMLNEIAHQQGFVKHKLRLESGSNHGDNYMGIMTSVKLIGERVEDDAVTSETLNLICKMAPTNKERRDAFQTVAAFEREIYMYTEVLPTFVKFQQEKGLTADESFWSFPKVYAWTADEVNEIYALIMEDLRPKNFVMWPRQNPVDFSIEKLLFTQLGRFHAISFALKDQRPEVFAEFKKLEDILTIILEKGSLESLTTSTFNRATAALKSDRHKRLVQGLKTNYLTLIKQCFTTEKVERFGVINHGDAWINNFLFQYDENPKELKDICFLDWQLSRYASPALDILHHIFSSTRKELRDQSYIDLLRIYHTALSDTVRKLGSDPEKLFRFSDLMDELKMYGHFALILGIVLAAFVMTKPKNVRDLDEYTKRLANGEDVDLFTREEDSDTYIKVVNDLVGDIIECGYILLPTNEM